MSPEQTTLHNQNLSEFGNFNGEPLKPVSVRSTLTLEQFVKNYPLRHQIWSLANGRKVVEEIPAPEVLQSRLRMLNNLDLYVTEHRGRGRQRILREKQLAVFVDTHEFLEKANTEGYVEAPTGFGKTVLFSEIIRATDERTLIVVPSRLLVEQTYDRLKKINTDLDIGRYYSEKRKKTIK